MKRIGVGHFETTSRMRELVNEVLDSGRISYGPKSKGFEEKFSTLHNRNFGVLSNSGTSSLQVALQAMKEIHGWADGDEVIVPAVTFVATVNIVLHNNMKPVLVDVDPFTYNINPNLIFDACTTKTRAIIPVHLFGQPADMSEIWAKSPIGLRIIEDSCESMFATHNGKPVGSMGDIGCFSMYVAHLITMGVGGISITNNPDYAAKMRSLVNHGRDGIYIDMDTQANSEVINRRFNFDTVGHSFRITELEAALGLAQLENWQHMIRDRRYNWFKLTQGLRDLEPPGYLTTPISSAHACMMYPIMTSDWIDKWELCNYLEERGIETREMLPLTNQPVYHRMGLFDPTDYPAADRINRNGFYIACHPGLTEDDLDYIVEVFHDYFKEK